MVRPPARLLINDPQEEDNGAYHAHPNPAPDDGLDLFRGLMAALPIGITLWAGIIKAVLAWL